MKEIGLTATEFGPQGWLPIEAEARAKEVGKYGLKPVGAFFLAIMHDPEIDPIPAVKKELEAFKVAGGEYLILAADSGRTAVLNFNIAYQTSKFFFQWYKGSFLPHQITEICS